MKLLYRTSATTQVAPVYHALTSYPAHNRIISSTPMNPPRRCRCLPAILAALALSCLASASAIAQTPPAPVLDLRNFSDINLILRFPVTSGGKTYYYLDRNGNGNSGGNRAILVDGMTRYELQTLLNDGNGVRATQEGGAQWQ